MRMYASWFPSCQSTPRRCRCLAERTSSRGDNLGRRDRRHRSRSCGGETHDQAEDLRRRTTIARERGCDANPNAYLASRASKGMKSARGALRIGLHILSLPTFGTKFAGGDLTRRLLSGKTSMMPFERRRFLVLVLGGMQSLMATLCLAADQRLTRQSPRWKARLAFILESAAITSREHARPASSSDWRKRTPIRALHCSQESRYRLSRGSHFLEAIPRHRIPPGQPAAWPWSSGCPKAGYST